MKISHGVLARPETSSKWKNAHFRSITLKYYSKWLLFQASKWFFELQKQVPHFHLIWCSVGKGFDRFWYFHFSFFEVQLILKLQYSIVFLRLEWKRMEYHHFLKSKFVVSVKNSAFFQVNEILIGNSDTTKNFIFMKFSWLPPSPSALKLLDEPWQVWSPLYLLNTGFLILEDLPSPGRLE